MPYALPADIAAYLGISLTEEQQTKVTSLIAGIEDSIHRLTNRSWSNGASHTESFDGGAGRLFPKHVPIDTVTSLTLDGRTLTEDSDFYVYATYITLGFLPSAGRKRLELVYTADDPVPAAIKQAIIRWAAEQYVASNQVNTPGVKRLTQGPVTIEYNLSTPGSSQHIPDYIKEVVAQYRLPAL